MARSFACPRWGTSGATLTGYLREAVSEGAAWLSTQKPASEYEALLERLGPSNAQLNLAGQSNITYPKTERLAREIVASLTSFSHVGEFKPAVSQSLYAQAGVLTALDHNWFHLPQTIESHRTLAQLAVTLGTGYAWQTWDPHFHGTYKGDIRLQALAPDRVTFVQLPSDHDIQRAYITLIREELPITLAKRIYRRTNPAFAESLLPDRDAPGWIAKGLKKVQQFLSPALRVRGMHPGDFDQDTAFPVVDIFHAYINDDTLNESGSPMTMGSAGTNWSYTVPTLGGEFPTGLINPATGALLTRSADPVEAQLFPLKRYIIFARSTEIVAYDNSSPWWHGLTPLVRLRFNDWPWEALGRSCVGMIGSMEDSANAIMQGMEDSISARLDPPMLYNDQAVTTGFAEAFNPRKAGSKAAADFSQGDVIKFPVPYQVYDLPPYIADHLKYLDDRMEYLTGARDLTAMAKAKQVPSSDSIEKFLEMAGPLVQDMVRAIILPYQQLGEMRKSDYFQFYTYERLLQTINDAGDEEDWVYTPELLVGRLSNDTVQTRQDRARGFLTAFKYRVSQSGITEINRMSTKLFYLQLQKLGFPIDWWSIAKVAQLPGFGAIPKKLDEDGNASEEECHSILEKWMAQVRMQHEMAEKYGGGGGQPPPKGRPNSGHKPPHMDSKSGGTRSTVATS
jgi:hypothetical protein